MLAQFEHEVYPMANLGRSGAQELATVRGALPVVHAKAVLPGTQIKDPLNGEFHGTLRPTEAPRASRPSVQSRRCCSSGELATITFPVEMSIPC